MNRFLNMDTPFFQFMGKIGDIFLLNLMWVVFSIPIITIGASTTAAFSVGMRLARGDDGLVMSRFWKSFRQNFKQATIIHIILLVIGVVLYFDMRLWLQAGGSVGRIMLVVTTIIGVVYAAIVLYVYAVLARFDNTIKNTLKNAALIAIANLPITLLLFAGTAIYVIANGITIIFTIIMILFGMGLLAYLYGILYNVAFRKFVPVRQKPQEDEWHVELEEDAVYDFANGAESEASRKMEAAEAAPQKEMVNLPKEDTPKSE